MEHLSAPLTGLNRYCSHFISSEAKSPQNVDAKEGKIPLYIVEEKMTKKCSKNLEKVLDKRAEV